MKKKTILILLILLLSMFFAMGRVTAANTPSVEVDVSAASGGYTQLFIYLDKSRTVEQEGVRVTWDLSARTLTIDGSSVEAGRDVAFKQKASGVSGMKVCFENVRNIAGIYLWEDCDVTVNIGGESRCSQLQHYSKGNLTLNAGDSCKITKIDLNAFQNDSLNLSGNCFVNLLEARTTTDGDPSVSVDLYGSAGIGKTEISGKVLNDFRLNAYGENRLDEILVKKGADPCIRIGGTGTLTMKGGIKQEDHTPEADGSRGKITIGDSVQLNCSLFTSTDTIEYLSPNFACITSRNSLSVLDQASLTCKVTVVAAPAAEFCAAAVWAEDIRIQTEGTVTLEVDDRNGDSMVTAFKRRLWGLAASGSIRIERIGGLEASVTLYPEKPLFPQQRLVSACFTSRDGLPGMDPSVTVLTLTQSRLSVATAFTVTFEEALLDPAPVSGAIRDEGLSYTVPLHQSFSFTVPDSFYFAKNSGFTVKANGSVLTPDSDGVYTVEDLRGDVTVTLEGVKMRNSPVGSIPANQVLCPDGGAVSLPLDFYLISDTAEKVRSGSASVSLCIRDETNYTFFVFRELDCSGIGEDNRVHLRIPLIGKEPGTTETYRLLTRIDGIDYDFHSTEFRVRYTDDPAEADNRYPEKIEVRAGDQSFFLTDGMTVYRKDGAYGTTLTSGTPLASYDRGTGTLSVINDIQAVTVSGWYAGDLTVLCYPGSSITSTLLGYAIRTTGNLTIETRGGRIVCAREGEVNTIDADGNVTVTGTGSLILHAESSAGPATGIRVGPESSIVFNTSKAVLEQGIFIELSGRTEAAFNREAAIDYCRALVIEYAKTKGTRAAAVPVSAGFCACNRAVTEDGHEAEIFKSGYVAAVSLSETSGGDPASTLAEKIAGRTYRIGSEAQAVINHELTFLVADPGAYRELLQIRSSGCTTPEKTGTAAGGYTEYRTLVTGTAKIIVDYTQSLFRNGYFQNHGNGTGTLHWTLTETEFSTLSFVIEVRGADGRIGTVSCDSFTLLNGSKNVQKTDSVWANAVEARPVVRIAGGPTVAGTWVTIDWDFWLDYTDRAERFNQNACIPEGDVGSVAVMDLSQFVHGGSGDYRYYAYLTAADGSRYDCVCNEKTGVLRLMRDTERPESGRNLLGTCRCYVQIEDLRTEASANLYFNVGAFVRNPDVTAYPTYVNGAQVRSDSLDDVLGDGTARYVPAAQAGGTATLILTNAVLDTARLQRTGSSCDYFGAILTFEKLDIVVNGSNTVCCNRQDYVTGPASGPIEYLDYECEAAITTGGSGSFTLKGDGRLSVVGDKAFAAENGCLIDGPEVICSTEWGATDSSEVKFRSGTLYMISNNEGAIYAGDPVCLTIDKDAETFEVWITDEDEAGKRTTAPGSFEDYDGFYQATGYDHHARAVCITSRGVCASAADGVLTYTVSGCREGTARVAAAQYVGGRMTGFRILDEVIDLETGASGSFTFTEPAGAAYRVFLLRADSRQPVSPCWCSD